MQRRGKAAADGGPDYLIIGLGNPGAKYAATRHNAGWWVLDELARRHGAGGGYPRHQSTAQALEAAGRRALLIRPQTYMNLSGDALAAWLREHPDTPWVLVYDDTSVPPGEIRLKRGGGAGGHNGVASVIERVKSQQFDRLKVGIGPPPHPGGLSDYVLGLPSAKEQELLETAVAKAADALERLLAQGFDKAAQFVTGGDARQEERRQARAAKLAAEADGADTPVRLGEDVTPPPAADPRS